MVILTDKYLTGDFVKKLTDKKFEVLEAGQLEQMQQADGTEKENLVLPVKLSDGQKHLWIPNNTSKKVFRKLYSDDTQNWIGKKAEFEVVKQNVRGEMKEVIYIK